MSTAPALRIKCSPYREMVAVARGDHFGIAGKGYCTVNDRLLHFDKVCSEIEWSEHGEVLYCFYGKGHVQLFDTQLVKIGQDKFNDEVVSCKWNYIKKDLFAVLMNDAWVIGNVNGNKQRYMLQGGNDMAWSPRDPFQIAIPHSNGFSIFDIRQNDPIMHLGIDKCMSVDYSKYTKEIAIGTVNHQVLLYDERTQKIRMAHKCHQLTVKSVKYSPFHPNQLATCSYDLHTKYWDIQNGFNLVFDVQNHSEIVSGIDFSLFNDVFYDCGWDGKVQQYKIPELTHSPNVMK